LDRETQKRFAAEIALLAESLGRPRVGIDVRLRKGLKGMARLRVGDYRGILQREGSTLTLSLFAHRSSVY